MSEHSGSALPPAGIAALPLAGITVVSLEQAIAAPLASRHLADWGARVIKVERPGAGDFARDYDHVLAGQSSQFVWVNRSKESLAVDIKTPEGRAAIEALLAGADVLIQNLAPGAAARLGLDAASALARHPRLIACDISGYGSSGPFAGKKAYDLLVQCETGFLSINGTPDSMAKCGISIADIAAGMYALQGVLMGLYQRGVTGRGMAFAVSLFDALTEWMGYPALYAEGSGAAPRRSGPHHATIAPYGPFRCGDGRQVFLSVQSNREWAAFCDRVLGQADLAHDPRFQMNADRHAHRDTLQTLIETRFAALDAPAALALLEAAGIANANLNTVADFIAHDQITSRGRAVMVDSPTGPVRSYLPAVTIPGLAPVMGPVPGVGSHTDAILARLEGAKGQAPQ